MKRIGPWADPRYIVTHDGPWIAVLVWLARAMTPPDNRTERRKRP